MGNKMKRILAAVLYLLSPIPAAAQWGQFGPPRPAASLGAFFSYAAPEGLISRRSGVSGEAALGSAGGFALRVSADLAHLRGISAGYFPGELYKAGLAVTADNGETRLSVNLNSNSDRPFNSSDETDLGFTLLAPFSRNGGGSWYWGLNYSSRRSFVRGRPLPFITYRYVSETFMFVLPFMARWQATPELALSATYQPVKYFKAGLTWRPRPWLRAELEGGTALEQFLPAGRADKEQALFYEASYISLKPTLVFSQRFELTPGLGWQFGGLYYTGRRYDDYKAKSRLHGGPSAGLAARYLF